jgi:hypothetical protein
MSCVDPDQTYGHASNVDPDHGLLNLEMICVDQGQHERRATNVDPDLHAQTCRLTSI